MMMNASVICGRLTQRSRAMKIEGQVAIVTGAGAEGTGRAIALALARLGASVVVGDIDPLGGRETVDMVEARGARAAFVRADVRVRDDIRGMAAFAEQTFGGLDILVNNAGNTWAPHFRIARRSTGRRRSTSTFAAPCSPSRSPSERCVGEAEARS
jgi:NAD(P)-dependent dehydrogenase (short-subunit alcohol dehydrogenase family)